LQKQAVVTPTLFADRFLAWPGGRALDLSSGQKVWVRPVAPVDGAPAAAWARRCATLSALWHPHLVEMVDFGPAGREGGFEAFTDGPPQACWRGRDAATARALLSAVAFLHARGWRAGRLTWSQVVHHGGGPALMPDEETGMPLEPDDEPDPSVARARILAAEAERLERLLASCHGSPPVPSRWRGAAAPAAFATNACESLVLDTTRRLAEVLDTGVPGRPRALQLALPPEPQQRVLLRAIARTARARGYVPLAASLLEDGSRCIPREDLFEVVAQRHVLLLHRVGIATGEAGLALSLLRLGLESSRPHVVLLLFEPAARTTWSGRLSPTALQAREPRVSYAAQPVQAESRLRGRVLEACACITRGRHAAAERVLREHLGMTGRRGDRSGAGDAALALGRLLLLRGRAPEACHQFEAARQHFDAVRQVTWAARAAAFAALARTDAGRFEEAEAAAHAACLAASETGDGETRLFASTALARCLYWQGRYEEGQAAARDEGTLALSARPDPAVSRVAEPVMPFGTGRPADAWSGFPGWVDPHVGPPACSPVSRWPAVIWRLPGGRRRRRASARGSPARRRRLPRPAPPWPWCTERLATSRWSGRKWRPDSSPPDTPARRCVRSACASASSRRCCRADAQPRPAPLQRGSRGSTRIACRRWFDWRPRGRCAPATSGLFRRRAAGPKACR